MTELFPILLLLVLVVVLLTTSLKIAAEEERFAVFTLGQFSGFRGPGLIFVAPFLTRVHRLRAGDIGILTSSEFAEFNSVNIPVMNTQSLEIGQPVRIDGFDDTEPRIASSTQRATNQCPKCGHQY